MYFQGVAGNVLVTKSFATELQKKEMLSKNISHVSTYGHVSQTVQKINIRIFKVVTTLLKLIILLQGDKNHSQKLIDKQEHLAT